MSPDRWLVWGTHYEDIVLMCKDCNMSIYQEGETLADLIRLAEEHRCTISSGT